MILINPYFNFPGTAEAAISFYQSVLGGEIPVAMRYREVPGNESLNEAEADKMMHISLMVPNGTVIMATDAVDSKGWKLTEGNNFSLALSTSSKEEADTIFAGLSNGGKVTSPMKDEFWGDYFGMLIDKFGISWMISFDKKRGPE